MLKYLKLSLFSMVVTMVVGNQISAEDFSLASNAFANDMGIPAQFTCDGDNVSPQLGWGNPPSGAKTYVLVMDDADAKNPAGDSFVHWVVVNIPVGLGELSENVDLSTLEGVVAGVNDFGNTKYDGPCPPQGSGVHHYNFTLYALDSKLDLANGVTRNDVLAAMAPHLVGNVVLMGTYSRS